MVLEEEELPFPSGAKSQALQLYGNWSTATVLNDQSACSNITRVPPLVTFGTTAIDAASKSARSRRASNLFCSLQAGSGRLLEHTAVIMSKTRRLCYNRGTKRYLCNVQSDVKQVTAPDDLTHPSNPHLRSTLVLSHSTRRLPGGLLHQNSLICAAI